jgi:hypothetical protein
MPATKSPAEEILKRVIDEAFVAVLKPRGFKRTAHNFHRRQGEVVQVVNVQLSQGSTWFEKDFYVNVGLAFDDICRLKNQEIDERPKEYQCDARGTRGRLEEFLRTAPDRWEISNSTDLKDTISALREWIEELATGLDSITSASSYRKHEWFRRHEVPTGVCAQILYLVGEMEAAKDEVQALCTFFADRRTISVPSYWIEELGLEKLRNHPELQ